MQKGRISRFWGGGGGGGMHCRLVKFSRAMHCASKTSLAGTITVADTTAKEIVLRFVLSLPAFSSSRNFLSFTVCPLKTLQFVVE